MNPAAPICVWVSRHPPSPQQARSLRDYQIVQINHTFNSADELWQAICDAGGRLPDLVMAIMEKPILERFLLSARAHRIPVIRPVMRIVPGNGYEWTGDWEQLHLSQYVTLWEPS